MNGLKHCLAAALVVLVPLLSAAPAEAKWYEIEVLVFEHVTPAGLQSEVWPKDVAIPLAGQAIDILAPAVVDEAGTVPAVAALAPVKPEPGSSSADAGLTVPPPEHPFQPLPESLFKLGEAKQRLAGSGYRTLVHLAWRQPVKPPLATLPIRITGGQDYAPALVPPESVPADTGSTPEMTSSLTSPVLAHEALWQLEGLLKLSASPFLNLESQLVLRQPAPVAAEAVPTQGGASEAVVAETAPSAATTTGASDSVNAPASGSTEPDAPQYTLYPLQESRRLKSYETQYIDHPLMGLLVQVRPYEPPPGSEGSEAAEIIDEGKAVDADPDATLPEPVDDEMLKD